jgi:hypothetical protein
MPATARIDTSSLKIPGQRAGSLDRPGGPDRPAPSAASIQRVPDIVYRLGVRGESSIVADSEPAQDIET